MPELYAVKVARTVLRGRKLPGATIMTAQEQKMFPYIRTLYYLCINKEIIDETKI